MKRNPNRPRRREPYHYDATGAQYMARASRCTSCK